MTQNYYKTLGVSKEATTEEIRKAYHTLALKVHPDKNHGNQAFNQHFVEINNAYEILKNSKTRADYDCQYNDSSEEFETLTEIIIYGTRDGIAFIFSKVKELILNVSKNLVLKAKHQALYEYEKLKDKSAEVIDKLAEKVHDRYETLKDKSMKALGNVKHSFQEKFKDMISGSPLDSKIKLSEDQDSTVSEELHSPNYVAHDSEL